MKKAEDILNGLMHPSNFRYDMVLRAIRLAQKNAIESMLHNIQTDPKCVLMASKKDIKRIANELIKQTK